MTLFACFLRRRWQREDDLPQKMEMCVEDEMRAISQSDERYNSIKNRHCISFVTKRMEESCICRIEGCLFWGTLDQDHTCTVHFYKTELKNLIKYISDEKISEVLQTTRMLKIGNDKRNDQIISKLHEHLNTILDNGDGTVSFINQHQAHTIIDAIIPHNMRKKSPPEQFRHIGLLSGRVLKFIHSPGKIIDLGCCGFRWNDIDGIGGCEVIRSRHSIECHERIFANHQNAIKKRKMEDDGTQNKKQKWI